MRRFTKSSPMGVGLVCCALCASVTMAGPKKVDPAATEMLNLGLRGVYFVPNQGQWSDADVYFGLRGRGLDVAFRESSLTMHLTRASNESNESNEASPKRERGMLPQTTAATQASPKRERGLLRLDDPTPLPDGRGSFRESADLEHLTLTITFPGSNAVLPIGGNPQAAKFNYFVGGEGRGVASDVPSFGEIVYPNLYDGVDLHVMGNDDGVMKYEFHVAPGADYSQIRIAYDGIDSLCIDDAGNLQINTSFGILADGAPVVWQVAATSRAGNITSRAREEAGFFHASTSRAREEAVLDAGRDAPLADARGSSDQDIQNPLADARGSSDQTIPARFELCDDHMYRIALDAAPDPSRSLVIDPEIEWMYYLGGRWLEESLGIVVDSASNALVTGWTTSTNFEGQNNSRQGRDEAFALKISPAGELQWMTYLGGSEPDQGEGIAVDSADNALVTGWTASRNFQRRNNMHHGDSQDAFALKVSPSGQLLWMTYLGGNGNERGFGIAVDGADNVLVSGYTESTNFEGGSNSSNGNGDAFLLKVSPVGQLQRMAYLGGSDIEYAFDIAMDATGNALVAGRTASTDFEGRNNSFHGVEDAFALKVSPSGQLQWMTYLGGSSQDAAEGIAVDGADNVLVSGFTESTNFEGGSNSSNGNGDAFLLKVSPVGQLQWMTYLGGSSEDTSRDITMDGAGNTLVTGLTGSADFNGRNNSFYGGTTDAFALNVSPSGQLQWMTFLGGGAGEGAWDIAVDSARNALVAGWTSSNNTFEGRSNTYHGGLCDAFIVKLRLTDGPQLSVTATCPSGGPIQVSWSGATSGGLIALIFARDTGSFIIPNNRPCAGTQLGLGTNQIQVAFQGGAGASGSRTVNSTTGPNACGGYLQLLDLATCATSNVAPVE